jgi:hypothetical protein
VDVIRVEVSHHREIWAGLCAARSTVGAWPGRTRPLSFTCLLSAAAGTVCVIRSWGRVEPAGGTGVNWSGRLRRTPRLLAARCGVDAELVMSMSQVLREGMPGDDDLRGMTEYRAGVRRRGDVPQRGRPAGAGLPAGPAVRRRQRRPAGRTVRRPSRVVDGRRVRISGRQVVAEQHKGSRGVPASGSAPADNAIRAGGGPCPAPHGQPSPRPSKWELNTAG